MTERRDRLHEACGLLDHPGGTLHARLEDHAGGRGGIALEECLKRRQRGRSIGARDLAGAFRMSRRGESLRREEPRVEATMELRAFTHRHRPEGVTMVGTFHRDDATVGFLAD